MPENESIQERLIYTIGHSNQSLEALIGLLQANRIDVLADIRSLPVSRYAPQFDRDALRAAALAHGIRYSFEGDRLGGRPEGPEFYDPDGRVLYSQVAQSSSFLDGVSRLLRGAELYRIAILCAEENPAECHRHLLVARVLIARGAAIRHIRSDGRLQTEDEIGDEKSPRVRDEGQQLLFPPQETEPWKSTRSVLRRRAQRNSSAP